LATVCDLERVFGGLADRLPRVDDEEFTLTPETVPAVTSDLASDSVGLTWFLHGYNDMPVDLVAMYCQPRTLRLLGLLLLSRVLHPTDEDLMLRVTATKSEIREVVLDCSDVHHGNVAFYRSRVVEFTYISQFIHQYQRPRYPLAAATSDDCPAFVLTKGEFGPYTREELLTRDRLRISGRESSLLDLAAVFLDAGLPDSSATEFYLETAGFGGAQHDGAELAIWLPGSDWWEPDMPC